MPVYPVEWVDATARGNYPHMARHDAMIWERFLGEFALSFRRFAYDVALGGLLKPGTDDDLAQRLGFQYSTACKVDVVAERDEDCWLIEVKPDAHAGAVGQALVYTTLGEKDRPSDKPLVPVVVTNRCSEDIKYAAGELGVLVVCMDETPNLGR